MMDDDKLNDIYDKLHNNVYFGSDKRETWSAMLYLFRTLISELNKIKAQAEENDKIIARNNEIIKRNDEILKSLREKAK